MSRRPARGSAAAPAAAPAERPYEAMARMLEALDSLKHTMTRTKYRWEKARIVRKYVLFYKKSSLLLLNYQFLGNAKYKSSMIV